MTSITTSVDGDHFTIDQLTGKCDQANQSTDYDDHYPEQQPKTIIKLYHS